MLSREPPMSHQVKSFVNGEEYLALEREAEYKSEYLNGGVFAMTVRVARRRGRFVINRLLIGIARRLRQNFT